MPRIEFRCLIAFFPTCTNLAGVPCVVSAIQLIANTQAHEHAHTNTRDVAASCRFAFESNITSHLIVPSHTLRVIR